MDALTIAEILALVYKHEKAKGLRQLLTIALEHRPPLLNREKLQEEAADLRHMHLSKVAAIIEEFVPQFPGELDLVFCPYPADRPYDVQGWLRTKRRAIERRARERQRTMATIASNEPLRPLPVGQRVQEWRPPQRGRKREIV